MFFELCASGGSPGRCYLASDGPGAYEPGDTIPGSCSLAKSQGWRELKVENPLLATLAR